MPSKTTKPKVSKQPLPWFIEIWTYNNTYEAIRRDLIESIRKPGNGVHDHGDVTLVGGRRISFGGDNEAARLLKVLSGEA